MVASGNSDGRGRSSADGTGHSGGIDDLAIRLSDLARVLQDEQGVDETLQAIVDAAVDTIPGVQYAALSVVCHRRVVNTRAGTAALVFEVDRAQYETGEGPCLDAIYTQRTLRLSDMAAERRWPLFTARAAALGVGSMLSLQLFVQQDNLGALNLYSADKFAFDDDSEHVGLLFASHAAVAMSGAQQEEQLNKAIAARDVIGQAKGILMERYKVTADQAFTMLARVSQQTNIKLIEVARSLAHDGQFTERGAR
jgi:transcriptional regulator with GAF, ATPase, and Fis domain